MKLVAALAIVSFAASACSSTTVRAPAEPRSAPHVAPDAQRDFAGKWDTTYGVLSLSHFSDRLAGSYGDGSKLAWIEGVQRGDRFEFIYREPDESGAGWFELSDDGASFHGEWHERGQSETAEWNGTRAGAGSGERGFAGTWRTPFGTVRLAQDGAHVHGTYSDPAGSQLDGTVDGNVLRATYAEPGGASGRAVFELALDGARFRGVWRPGVEGELAFGDGDARPWNGERAVPVPGRRWLVVLEANWEESLGEHEYSYGSMLRAFFERVPLVEVRQRFFHDRADFVRVCREVADLAEPTVLYVSTHGSPAGIQAGDDLIDGATIGEALHDAKNLTLLHLGSCALLAGELGQRVRDAAGADMRFPISGYKVDVDWSASAIADLTYLDLILEHGESPERAAGDLRAMLSFAGDAAQGERPFEPLDLTLIPARD